MKSLRNSVKIIGHVGKDPEVRTFDNGGKCASFSVATTDAYRNRKGDKVEDTQWHNVVTWGKLAEIAGKFLKKGSEVAVEGRLTYRVYETAAGEKRYATQINANEMLMLSRR